METLEPTRELSKVDLPALGAPMRATNPALVLVCSGDAMLFLRPDTLSEEKASRGRLFRDALRWAEAELALRPLHLHHHPELRGVVGALLLHDGVGGRRQASALRPFLQIGRAHV